MKKREGQKGRFLFPFLLCTYNARGGRDAQTPTAKEHRKRRAAGEFKRGLLKEKREKEGGRESEAWTRCVPPESDLSPAFPPAALFPFI